MTINSILKDWSHRLPNGCPSKCKDYELLYQVILEMAEIPPLAPRITDAKSNVDFSVLNVSKNILQQIKEIYNQLSKTEKSDFDTNYRIHSITSFIAGGYKPFAKFYSITDSGKSTGSEGRGEIQVLLAVNESTSGGQNQHDILLPNGIWEVKEVGSFAKLRKSGCPGSDPKTITFRPAKLGFQRRGDIYSDINDFFVKVVDPILSLEHPIEEFKPLVNPLSYNQLEKFISIIKLYFTKYSNNIHKKELSRGL